MFRQLIASSTIEELLSIERVFTKLTTKPVKQTVEIVELFFENAYSEFFDKPSALNIYMLKLLSTGVP